MIAHVIGKIAEKFNSSVIVDVLGIGYEVLVPAGEFDRVLLGDEVKFYTYHHVREQSEELYGFSSLAGKKLFELLITVQGVGPKAALAVLSLGEIEQVRSAIARSDTAYISHASGVGKKTAERIIVDLSDKVGLPSINSGAPVQTEIAIQDDALDALIALGFTLQEATDALRGVDHSLTIAERVRVALRETKR